MPNLRILALLLVVAGCASPPRTQPPSPFWTPGSETASQRFEAAKRTEPELIAFLRRFPKGADLHNHLGGANYSEYLYEAARAGGKRFDVARGDFTDGTGDGTISLDQFEADAKLYNTWRDAMSMRGARPGVVDGHDHFFQTFDRMGSAGRSFDSLVAEVLERNRYQNVQYVELMAAPLSRAVIGQFIAVAAPAFDANNLAASLAAYRPLLDDPQVAQALRDELNTRDTAIGTALGAPLADFPVKLRYVLSLDRTWPPQRFFAATVLYVAAIRADPRFVAINIVAPEDAPASRRQFEAQMQILDFLWREIGPVNMTLHAGELVLRDSPVEPMQDRIRATIDLGHARRIGHGTSVAWERDLPGLLEQMHEHGILVEVALTSAQDILDVGGDAHPFVMYRSAGVPVCLSTDDEGVSRSNLTLEYVTAVRRHDLDYETLKDLSRNCLEYSFTGGESLYLRGDYQQLRAEFGDLKRGDWRPSPAQQRLLDADTKLALQVRLELAFAAFETSLQTGFREPVGE